MRVAIRAYKGCPSLLRTVGTSRNLPFPKRLRARPSTYRTAVFTKDGRDYWTPGPWRPDWTVGNTAHSAMAETCLRYLNFRTTNVIYGEPALTPDAARRQEWFQWIPRSPKKKLYRSLNFTKEDQIFNHSQDQGTQAG